MSKCKKCGGSGNVPFEETIEATKKKHLYRNTKIVCPHCKGTGIEPDVELISAEDAEIKRILDKQIWDVQGYNLIGKAVLERILRKLWSNARAYGEQEQKKVNAGTLRQMAKRESELSDLHSEKGGDAISDQHDWLSHRFEEVAKAIEGNKSKGEEDETTDVTPTTDNSNSKR